MSLQKSTRRPDGGRLLQCTSRDIRWACDDGSTILYVDVLCLLPYQMPQRLRRVWGQDLRSQIQGRRQISIDVDHKVKTTGVDTIVYFTNTVVTDRYPPVNMRQTDYPSNTSLLDRCSLPSAIRAMTQQYPVDWPVPTINNSGR